MTIYEMIQEERQRQIQQEGFTPERDDQYYNKEQNTEGDLALAAIAYASPIDIDLESEPSLIICSTNGDDSVYPWGNNPQLLHRSGRAELSNQVRIQQIVRACALLIAEAERLHRKEMRKHGDTY
jgi:hypothetical protein